MGPVASPLEEISRDHFKPKMWLPVVALTLTSCGLGMGVLLAVLVERDFIDVPWDAKVLPLLVLLGLVPFSMIGLVVSGVSWYRHRDWRSVISTVLGLLAIVAALVALLVIVGAALAGHPV
jgi:hypothetical protein